MMIFLKTFLGDDKKYNFLMPKIFLGKMPNKQGRTGACKLQNSLMFAHFSLHFNFTSACTREMMIFLKNFFGDDEKYNFFMSKKFL